VRFSCVWCCKEEERPVPNPKTLRWCKCSDQEAMKVFSA
jgi:hypothetical protein